ncbi:Chlorophyll A-B binding protein [Trema orientale]|uniref:Chlorophyll a-b binding protein, chloroplastic n=1 Tax=Trema orientale TaxID=63057 RepID=A0A2P5F8T8_TREOI|nr:Chlorophyll A-B binding protein [Trema orientale]
MATTVGRGLHTPPCSLSFTCKSVLKPSFGVAKQPWPAQTGKTRSRTLVVAQAQVRPTWLPGLDPPPYLDGSLAGDFGFDPLGLGEDPESLRWYVQAELVHARFAMLGVAGILLTDVSDSEPIFLTVIFSFLPSWRSPFEPFVDLLLSSLSRDIGFRRIFVETKRYMDFVSPGSQAQKGSFLGLEAALEGLEPGYPGGPLLNPLGLAKDIKNAHEWKLKEIKNGRLAMMAMLGFFVQASVTHVGPVDNLLEHLSDPWHKTIVQTLANSSP